MTSLPLLVVEDDRDLRDALCLTLELAGYAVIAAADGSEALALMAGRQIGLVISDVQMQPLDGLALLREIRHLHAQVPVVLMTAFGDIEHAVDALHGGASDYLAKPFESERLLQLVQRYCLRPADSGELGVMVMPVAEEPAVPVQTAVAGAAVDMKSVERAHILATLKSVNGSRKRAVERLGISERALRYKLQQYRVQQFPN
jgi:DNA-binding NtrC family response regulator